MQERLYTVQKSVDFIKEYVDENPSLIEISNYINDSPY